jgi:hypothetical protein
MYNSHIDEIVGQQRAPVRDTRNNTSELVEPVEVLRADRFHEDEVRGSGHRVLDVVADPPRCRKTSTSSPGPRRGPVSVYRLPDFLEVTITHDQVSETHDFA